MASANRWSSARSRLASLGALLLVAAVSSGAWASTTPLPPNEWQASFPPDTHAVILRVETQGAACASGFFNLGPADSAPYFAGFVILAAARSNHLDVNWNAGTPFETERTLLSAGVTFKADHPDGAHRDHVDVAGFGWSEGHDMENSTASSTNPGDGVGNCWLLRDLPESVRPKPTEWLIYFADTHPIESARVRVRERSANWDAGAAVITNVAYATSSEFHVRPTWEWDAVVDRQYRDGSQTVLAKTAVEVEEGLVGLFYKTRTTSAFRWESPEGRLGHDCAGVFACSYPAPTMEEWFIHGMEPGTWRFHIDAMHAEHYPRAALMWMDLEEPEYD